MGGDYETLDELRLDELAAPPRGARLARRSLVEMWGGVECTINRVGDCYYDQLERSGHYARLSDLDLFAELGIRSLRYPVLWERTAPHGVAAADWSWPDERLGRLRELGIRPIVGLVHHGSGPRSTSLDDPAFPEKLAEYAGAVAKRYPWVESYTPVNEIMTTARFSGLYGHWYPHGRDGRTFARVLLNECRGTVLAMRAIRQVNPRARLVQTDDLGKTFSTPPLAYQAAFDNERRWLGWDLLCGRVDRGHPMWARLVEDGIPAADLEWLVDNPCPPDVLGVNYYITSQRFLDHRLECYPEHTHGGNNRDRYADVEAVRVCDPGIPEVEQLLSEAWERYRLPLAITEAHLGCTREEQLRWLAEIWRGAGDLRKQGIPVLAVTAWSLLGAYDWNSLLTRNDGYYEPGVFDLRGGSPRPTALAGLIRDLAAGREPAHPVHGHPGWWRRPERLLYPAVPMDTPRQERKSGRNVNCPQSSPRPVLYLGGDERLRAALARVCHVRGLGLRPVRGQELDLTVRFAVEDALDECHPWAVLFMGGDEEDVACAEGAAVLAAACAARRLPLVVLSSERVFDGKKGSSYFEDDPVCPGCARGRVEAEVERQVLERYPEALMIRAGAWFGPWDDENGVMQALPRLHSPAAEGGTEVLLSPTYVPDLLNAALDLLIDGEHGIWHLTHGTRLIRSELARQLRELGDGRGHPLRAPCVDPGIPIDPPSACRALESRRGVLLPAFNDALRRYFQFRGRGAAELQARLLGDR